MMDMASRNQYLRVLQRKYRKAKTKKEKTRLLDEYCDNTGQDRKYVIRKINKSIVVHKQERRGKQCIYDGHVVNALAKLWRIFDRPCGQRLEPLLRDEVERLRALGELNIPDRVAHELRSISAATVDRRLETIKKNELNGKKYRKKQYPALYQKIPIRGNDWDRSQLGNVQIDFVEHCGQSAAGEYICSLSVTDVVCDRWEGGAIMGRGQRRTFRALTRARKQSPIPWREIHPDNDKAFINHHLYRYCLKENLGFSRSRPYRKNDNCYVEQKNGTHIRAYMGHLRYDTDYELMIMNERIAIKIKLIIKTNNNGIIRNIQYYL